MSKWKTTELTVEESERLMRQLAIELGRVDRAEAVLRIIAESGLGIFKAEEA